MSVEETQGGYNPGHPWYYVLGGAVLPPSVILVNVKQRDYQGYRSEIGEVDRKSEPQRSAELRRTRDEVRAEFWRDVSGYRASVRQLHRFRAERPENEEPEFADVHASVSLKHNHIFNDFGHLLWLDELLSTQPDLFDF